MESETGIGYFANLLNISETIMNATVKLTFWGIRVVKFDQCPDYIPLKAIIDISIASMLNHLKNPTLAPSDRTNGCTIRRNLWSLYQNSQAQVKAANCCTRLFVFVRELFIKLFTRKFNTFSTITVLSKNFTEDPSTNQEQRTNQPQTVLEFQKLLNVV